MDYFEITEMPGKQFFQCVAMRATINTDSCSSMWRQARDGDDRRYKCKGCPIGALHAGETAASQSTMMGSCLCARCHRPATRLIHSMVCVSCYNRQREWILGRNAKGKMPSKLSRLDRRVIGYMSGKNPSILRVDFSLDTSELMVATLRDSKNKVVFGFRGAPGRPLIQSRMF